MNLFDSSSNALFIFLFQILNIYSRISYAIHCFDCVSFNHNNPDCEDPFYRPRNINLRKDCVTGLPEKNGSFRATHCIKLVAHGHGIDYVIRTCSLDSGSGRLDKEIVRVSHCGYLSLENFHGLESIQNRILNGTSNLTTTTIFPRSTRAPLHQLHKALPLFRGCLSVCQSDECNSAMTTSMRRLLDYNHNRLFYLILSSWLLVIIL